MIRDSIELITDNDNGLFQTVVVPDKRKYKEVLNFEGKLYHYGIGAVISEDITPKFQGWTFEDYVREFKHTGFVRYLEPMSAYEDSNYIANETTRMEVAELKYDGHRGLLFIGDNFNRAFSRRESKKTKWFTENSDQIPHIRDLILPEFAGTVIDGEFDYGTDSMGVQSVMGAKPENAIQFQFKNGWIQYRAFDILYYKGINVQQMSLWKRKFYLYLVIDAFIEKYSANCNIEYAEMFMKGEVFEDFIERIRQYTKEEWIIEGIKERITLENSYGDKFVELVAEGKEGLMVKDLDMPYEQKRSKNFIKLKGMETWDCFIIGTTPPTKVYDGKDVVNWKFWEIDGKCIQFNNQATAVEWAEGSGSQAIPVTKPYFMGWCGAIEFAVHKPMTEDDLVGLMEHGLDEQAFDDGSAFYVGDKPYWAVHVGDCKGLSDSLLEDIKQNGEKYIREKRVLEVLANGLINKETGTLRHPRFKAWRDDKSWEQCDFNSHIREVK